MKTSFTKQLKGYSALAGSFLTMHTVNAQIVYTDLHPDVILGGTIPNTFPLIDDYDLDLNNDGVYDFHGRVKIIGPNQFGSYYQDIRFYGLGTPNGDFNRMLVTHTGNSYAEVVVPYIGGLVLDTSGGSFYGNGGHVGYSLNGGDAGIFWDKEAYVAVDLRYSGQDHLGWVRIAVDHLVGDTPTMVIKDYAYNSAPNQPILTGQRINNSCPDPLEPKWYGNFTPTISLNTTSSALISPPGDIDKLKFTVLSSAPNVRVILSNLPKNYNLRLLNSASAVIATSKNPGLMNDTVIANNLAAGTYYAEVSGGKKEYQPDKCYSIIAEASATPYREASETTSENAIGELRAYPNPANDFLTVSSKLLNAQTRLGIYDMMGKLVLTGDNTSIEPDGSIKINISSLSKGSYILHSESEKIVGVTKFVVQR